MKKVFPILFLLPLLSACSTLMPYDSEFTCPGSFHGKCISLQGAYEESVNGLDGKPAVDKKGVPKVTASVKLDASRDVDGLDNQEIVAHTSYKESLFKRLDGLIKDPTTPMVAPPQVMRILLLPYKGEGNELYSPRYVYFFVDDPKWVIGDSVEASEED
jgi:conjugal transfer pilus assembly protein TraV